MCENGKMRERQSDLSCHANYCKNVLRIALAENCPLEGQRHWAGVLQNPLGGHRLVNGYRQHLAFDL